MYHKIDNVILDVRNAISYRISRSQGSVRDYINSDIMINIFITVIFGPHFSLNQTRHKHTIGVLFLFLFIFCYLPRCGGFFQIKVTLYIWHETNRPIPWHHRSLPMLFSSSFFTCISSMLVNHLKYPMGGPPSMYFFRSLYYRGWHLTNSIQDMFTLCFHKITLRCSGATDASPYIVWCESEQTKLLFQRGNRGDSFISY